MFKILFIYCFVLYITLFNTIMVASILESNNNSVIATLKKPLLLEQKNSFFLEGIETITYAGNLKYYFYGSQESINSLENDTSIVNVYNITNADKVSKDFIYPDENICLVKIILFKLYDNNQLSQLFKEVDSQIIEIKPNFKLLVLKLPSSQIDSLLSLPLVQYIENYSPKLEIKSSETRLNQVVSSKRKKVRNLIGARLSSTNLIWDSPYNLSGKGIKIAIVDEGKIRASHQEFISNGYSRVNTQYNNGVLSKHSTHVAGTIGAYGINPNAQGMAYNAYLHSYYFNDFSFASAMLKAYNDSDIMLSNHSYGYFYKVYLGVYNTDAMAIDRMVYKNPYLNAFIASGNDRDKSYYESYGITKGPVNAKNILTIGAIDDQGIALASFSSTGPVLDGRIKPDLVANGTMIYSTGSKDDYDYFFMNGTSMSTPIATGIAALMLEKYKNITNQNIRHDLLKSILINTAIDKGRVGPDFEYGYGLIDAKAAIDLIDTIKNDNRYIKENIIRDKENINYCIDNTIKGKLKTTIAWTDMEGNPANQEKTLVNDLDISIKKDRGEIIYPFSLDRYNPTKIATTKKPNRVDNIEQIQVLQSNEDGFILNVNGTQIVTHKQQFALVSNKPFINLPNPPIHIKAMPIDNHSMHIYWKDTSDSEQKFDVFRDGKLICTTEANKENMVDVRLQPNTTYQYKIATIDVCNRESFSKTLYIKTPNWVNAPSDFQIDMISDNALLLQWKDNSNNEKGFKIYRDSQFIYTTTKNQTSFLDMNFDPDANHEYKVIVFNNTEKSKSKSIIFKDNNYSGYIYKKEKFDSFIKSYYFSLKKDSAIDLSIYTKDDKSTVGIKVFLESLDNILLDESLLKNFSRIIFKSIKNSCVPTVSVGTRN